MCVLCCAAAHLVAVCTSLDVRNKFKKFDTSKGRKAAVVIQKHVRGFHMRKVRRIVEAHIAAPVN
jgi:hypothetical protein